MSTKQQQHESEGKPTIAPDTHDANVGQREPAPGEADDAGAASGGKATITPDNHDGNVGQRG